MRDNKKKRTVVNTAQINGDHLWNTNKQSLQGKKKKSRNCISDITQQARGVWKIVGND